ncbi:PHP domain-containing protein [Alkalispirochaeta alkalica]|uniref:PHP domain-containing protein n=1 Tax=Alkalispirochaeta alkalica TaxID=46356 RepID=UPI00037E9029|nr:hypothetical protein [Alkalispirochaeta alkalica]
MKEIAKHLVALEQESQEARLQALRDLVASREAPLAGRPQTEEVNNHVHTHYSFSPYSPSAAAFLARWSGLRAVGSVDHDSIGAARELVEAARIVGIGSTVGAELRVSFENTPFSTRRLNNPDSIGIAYIVLHGVPLPMVPRVEAFLAPLQRVRNERNRAQVEGLNGILASRGLPEIDFDRQVLPLSWADRGGSVTERHILSALARLMEDHFGRGEKLVRVLNRDFGLTLSPTQEGVLLDRENPHYHYDLLGAFKGNFVESFFIQPAPAECLPVEEVVAFGNEIGAVPAYAYLGDVGESPTGDKAAQAFEDAFLDELFLELPRIGFRAVTYMPPRNTRQQLQRVRTLSEGYGLMEISGVDINSSRQVFTCPEVMQPEFRHLVTTTWGLIAHEKLSALDPRWGLFHRENPLAELPLPDRITRYGEVARGSDLHRPEDLGERAIAAFPALP